MGTLVSWFCVDGPPEGCEQGTERRKEDLRGRAEPFLPTSPMKEAGNNALGCVLREEGQLQR